jgi:2-methylisocitrate lyase-like PEP mutase family enzyme
MGAGAWQPAHMTSADRFRRLHRQPPLVLPNAWDALSARLIEDAGASAIATTSSGISWALGVPDGQHLSRQEMASAVARIAAAVDVPVSADMEAGYDDVGATVAAVVEAGAVGLNLEDSPGTDGRPLLDAEVQAGRIRAARTAAAEAGLPELFVNARTDVLLRRAGDAGEVVRRAAVYAEAGADGLFVPGLVDPEIIADLVRRVDLPVNILAGPGAPPVAELAGLGVTRISVGSALTQAVAGLVREAARELLSAGTYRALEGGIDYRRLNTLAT